MLGSPSTIELFDSRAGDLYVFPPVRLVRALDGHDPLVVVVRFHRLHVLQLALDFEHENLPRVKASSRAIYCRCCCCCCCCCARIVGRWMYLYCTCNVWRESHHLLFFLFSFFFFHLTYSRWTSSLPSCLWSQRIFPSLPGSRLTFFLSRCKFSTLTTRQPMVEFYLLTFPRFPLRKKEHKSYFGKNRTHDFRISACPLYTNSGCGKERRILIGPW